MPFCGIRTGCKKFTADPEGICYAAECFKNCAASLETPPVSPSNSSDLLNCPFCGKNDAAVFPDGGVFIAECRYCRAASRRMPTLEMATKAWNKRAV